MTQIPPIDDAYINEIIKSNGPYNPALIKTQGTKMRELIKLLRDRMEQGDTGVVRITGDQNISGTKTFTLLKAEGISVNNLANPALNTVISPVNGVQTKLLNLNAGSFAVQLAASGLSALRTQTLQDKSGVIALISDIQSERFNPIAGTGISLNGVYPNITINTTGIDSTPDATTLIRGKIRLSGDLAGNADAPTVPGLVGKENLTNKSTDVNLGNSNALYPSQHAVKSYIDAGLGLKADNNGVGATGTWPISITESAYMWGDTPAAFEDLGTMPDNIIGTEGGAGKAFDKNTIQTYLNINDESTLINSISGSADKWNGQEFIGENVTGIDSFLTNVNGTNKYGYSSKSQVKSALAYSLDDVVNNGNISYSEMVVKHEGTGKLLSIVSRGGVTSPGLQAYNAKTGDYINLGLQQDGGNVGIGTWGPTEKLQVNGNIRISTGEGGGLVFDNGLTIFRAGSTGLAFMGGDFGIGITPSAKLDVNGTGNFSGNVTAPTATILNAPINSTDVVRLADLGSYQNKLTLTTTGSSGAATLIGNTLNIPQYSGGGGGSGWSLTGNTGTIDGTNFIGTTDDVPLTFKINNTHAGKITNSSTFIGRRAGLINTGNSNTSIGSLSLQANTTGYNNTANGQGTLAANKTGNSNTATGTSSLQLNTTGYGNTADGVQAMETNTTGYYNTALGALSDVSTGDLHNATAIGATAIVDASNKVQIGNTNVTSVKLGGTSAVLETSQLKLTGIVEYADNAAAIVGGLAVGKFYRTGDLLKIVH